MTRTDEKLLLCVVVLFALGALLVGLDASFQTFVLGPIGVSWIALSFILGWFGRCLPLAWAPRATTRAEALRAAWIASLPTLVLLVFTSESRALRDLLDAEPGLAPAISAERALACTLVFVAYLAAFLWRITRPHATPPG